MGLSSENHRAFFGIRFLGKRKLLRRAVSSDAAEKLYGMDGDYLFRVRDKSSDKEFLLRSDGVELHAVDANDARNIVWKDCQDLMKAMEEADPWRIRKFTGSVAFAEMKKAMQDTLTVMQSMPDQPGDQDRTRLDDQLKALGGKVKDYLKSKNPLTENTKDSERLRINAANRALRLIKESRIIMDQQKKLQKVRQEKQAKAMVWGDDISSGKKINGSGERKVKYGSPQSRLNALTLENENALTELNRRMYDFYTVKLAPEDPVRALGRDIFAGVDAQTMSPKKPAEQVAKMVAFDLIMRERADRKAIGGPVEEKYLAKPEEFCAELAKTKSIQEFVTNLDTEGFLNFLDAAVNNKRIDLTNKILMDTGNKLTLQTRQVPSAISKENGMKKTDR